MCVPILALLGVYRVYDRNNVHISSENVIYMQIHSGLV